MKKVFFLFAIVGLHFSFFGSSPSWNFDQKSWNNDTLVRLYYHNSELQRQWAWELLGKFSLKGDEKILDFGCGDGKVSAEISRLVKQGSVDGLDISDEMVRFASLKFPSYAYTNLQFHQTRSASFADSISDKKYDVITAFCVFHLVANPLETLKNLKKHLNTNGHLLLVIPAGKNPEFFQAANETFEKYGLEAPWKKTPPAKLSMRTLEGARAILQEAGFRIKLLEMVDTDNPFYDAEELIAWMVGNTTANWSIPLEISKEFFTDLVRRMLDLDPHVIDKEGRHHFKLSRIHVIAS